MPVGTRPSCTAVSLYPRNRSNRLSQPRRVRTRTACLASYTLESGEVGPEVCDRLLTWWLIPECAVFERGTRFFDEFRLSNVLLINPWRQQTGSGHPEWSLMCAAAESDWTNLCPNRNPSTHHAVTCFVLSYGHGHWTYRGM